MTEAGSVDGAVVFTDLVGFTEFTDALGDQAALDLLERQIEIVREELRAAGDGRVVKELGDGLMLWFSSAAAAVVAARSIRDRLCLERMQGFPLAVRVGVHSGPAMQRGDDVIGHTVNVASRIADTAGPDEVLVSEETLRALASERITSHPIGAVYVKGVAEPVWLSRLPNAERETGCSAPDQDASDR